MTNETQHEALARIAQGHDLSCPCLEGGNDPCDCGFAAAVAARLTQEQPPAPEISEVERLREAYALGQADMRERAAQLCDQRGAEEQEGHGLTRGAQNYFRARNAVRELAIASLSPSHEQGDKA